jgi:hypothetical protein
MNKITGAYLIATLLAVLLLSNTVSAELVVGPPIGANDVAFVPETPEPGSSVVVTISWWITNIRYTDYKGPFNLNIWLEGPDGNPISGWTIHDSTGIFSYPSSESSPYTYIFTEDTPSDGGVTYKLHVQIVATNVGKEVGKSGNWHPFLVASDEGNYMTVPEFTTIALPVAAILGLFLFFNNRKRRIK